jgi:enterochelin esterase-like enzyme
MSTNHYTQRVIEAHNVYSSHLNEERTIKVCLPMNYDPGQQYPVIYCHDGGEFFTHGRISTIANRMVAEGKLDPLFIVGVTVNKAHRTDDYLLGGLRNDAYIRFVMEECIPFVETRYPILGDTNHRFMAGISLGGMVTLEIALRYPEVFRKLLLFSGAFYENMQERVTAIEDLSHLEAFMVVGRQETEVETQMGTLDFLTFNRQMRDILLGKHADIEYHEADGKHLWGFWQSQLPDALGWLMRHVSN